MGIRLELGAVSRDDVNGVYTVRIKAIREGDNKLVAGKDFEAETAAELKAKVKPMFESLIEGEQAGDNIRSVAQKVIDEIMNEVVQ